MKLFLLRHALQRSTLVNVDTPLSPKGEEQAELLAKRMKQFSVDRFFASTLRRSIQTAEYLKEPLGLDYEIREELKEIDFGELTGKSWEENTKNFSFFLEKKKKMAWDLPYPGGESAEQVFMRGSTVVKELLEEGVSSALIVTHGGWIRSMITGLLGMDFAKSGLFGKNLENTSITELYYDETEERWYLNRFNDFAHLEDRASLLRSCTVQGADKEEEHEE